jgi:hypothetical protein
VDELAIDQAMLASFEMQRAGSVFLQSDKAPDGSEAMLFVWWKKSDTRKTAFGSIRQFKAGLAATGKKAVNIAEGVDHALTKIYALSALQIFGLTSDSGSGTPESMAAALDGIGRLHVHGMAVSCLSHDAQSIFRLPMEHYIGVGGLGNKNGVQAGHALYDLLRSFFSWRTRKDYGAWTVLTIMLLSIPIQ